MNGRYFTPNNSFVNRNPFENYCEYLPQLREAQQKKLVFQVDDSLNKVVNTRMKESVDFKQFTLDIDKVLRGEDKRTTLMIKNIPNKYNINILFNEINSSYYGKYDFLYLPLDPSNKCNLGFAFINLVDPLQILLFVEIFKGKSWKKFNSLKVNLI